MNLHSQLSEKCFTYVSFLANEINQEEAAIFQNKKYKDIMKLSSEISEDACSYISEYNLSGIITELVELSKVRQEVLYGQKSGNSDILQVYADEMAPCTAG